MAFIAGVAMIAAVTLAEPRNIVLLDIAQLMAVALIVELIRLARSSPTRILPR